MTCDMSGPSAFGTTSSDQGGSSVGTAMVTLEWKQREKRYSILEHYEMDVGQNGRPRGPQM